jgi:DNA-binding transcriptional regulator GbsR (MarR family)
MEKDHKMPEVFELASLVGQFIEYWGFKEVHGRTWTYLFLSSRPLSAQDLQGYLQVSKALMSMTLQDLLSYEVIEKLDKLESGKQVYIAKRNFWQAIIKVLRFRERQMFARICIAYKILRDIPDGDLRDAGLDPERVNILGRLIKGGETFLNGLINLQKVDLSFWTKL